MYEVEDNFPPRWRPILTLMYEEEKDGPSYWYSDALERFFSRVDKAVNKSCRKILSKAGIGEKQFWKEYERKFPKSSKEFKLYMAFHGR